MTSNFSGEQWSTVTFNFEFTNNFRLEVSNLGRLRTFNKISDGKIIKGSVTEGYRIVRLKLYRPRTEKENERFDYLQQQVVKLSQKLKSQIKNGESGQAIDESAALLQTIKKNLSKELQQSLKKRTINHHFLVHRLVAQHFVPQPTAAHTVVAHLDHDKMNNKAGNLKWMTPEENYAHQKNSPHVIKEMQGRAQRLKANTRQAKLTVTKVMLLKKLLNEGKPMKQLVKLFKITDTQILRIKRGENWADIPAAS